MLLMFDNDKENAMHDVDQPSGNLGLSVSPSFPAGTLSLIPQMMGGALEKPFSNRILLLDDAYVAGTTHVDGIEEMLKDVQPGDRIEFLRDPENIFDEWAIKVILPGKGRIGFVPEDLNQIVARLMDGGKCVFGQVTGVEKLGRWMKVSMEVFLDD